MLPRQFRLRWHPCTGRVGPWAAEHLSHEQLHAPVCWPQKPIQCGGGGGGNACNPYTPQCDCSTLPNPVSAANKQIACLWLEVHSCEVWAHRTMGCR